MSYLTSSALSLIARYRPGGGCGYSGEWSTGEKEKVDNVIYFFNLIYKLFIAIRARMSSGLVSPSI